MALWSRKIAGLWTADDEKAAAILAARQPTNPFFLLLHLGNDFRVVAEIKNKCLAGPEDSEMQWAWERSTSEQAWRNSMRWDCIFIIKALSKFNTSNRVTLVDVAQPPARLSYVPIPSGATIVPEFQLFNASGNYVTGAYLLNGRYFGYKWHFGDSQIDTHQSASSISDFVTADGMKWIVWSWMGLDLYENGTWKQIKLPTDRTAAYVFPRIVSVAGTTICGAAPDSDSGNPPSKGWVGLVSLNLDEPPVITDGYKIGDVEIDLSENQVKACLAVTPDGYVIVSGERGGAVWGAFGYSWKPVGTPGFIPTAASINATYFAEYRYDGSTARSQVRLSTIEGQSEDLPIPNEWSGFKLLPTGVAYDGRTVTAVLQSTPPRVMVWQRKKGWETLDQFVADLGLPAGNWKQERAISLSGDGRALMAVVEDNNDVGSVVVLQY